MIKYIMNDNWDLETFDDQSDLYLLVVEQGLPACSFIKQYNVSPEPLKPDYTQLVQQYEETEVDDLLQIHVVKVPHTKQVCDQVNLCDNMEKGSTKEAIDAINNILNRADCEILESWIKTPLTEKKHKIRKRKKPYSSETITTGCPALNMDFFNSRFGTGDLGSSNCGDSDCFNSSCGEALMEAKRYIKRYYIRPQNIFCSNKAEILQALVQDVGEANCSVYSLKSLEDHDDVHLLKPSDIIYYYDDGILFDKNRVKVMDYDLNVKHEEERKKFANVDAVSDDTFDREYEDRLVESKDSTFDCCICGEKSTGYGNNPDPLSDEGKCCDACNLKFVIPARIEALYGDKQE